jgi:predicted outer membrane repeat protein
MTAARVSLPIPVVYRQHPTSRRRFSAAPLLALAPLLAVFALAIPAYATTYTVTNTASSGSGSLAAAIGSAASGDTIDFASGVTGTITLGGTLTLTTNVTITGPGANLLTISGGGTMTVFTVNSGVTASISGLTITGGGGSGYGSGIFNQGTLTVSNCTLSGNSTGSGSSSGGGIDNYGTLTVSNSTISNNTAGNRYGGGINNQGTLTVSNSTFSGNTASLGGGISAGIGSVTVSNSTFSNNTASNGGGGGISAGIGSVTVSNSTFSGNTAANYGGGIYSQGSFPGMSTTITNSIVAGNITTNAPGDDCDGCTSSGTNLISTSSSSPSPMLGPLQNNGGPTETMMPLTGSPALNAGSGSTLPTDQRGFPRPTGSGVTSDLGAVQVGPLVVTTTAEARTPARCATAAMFAPCAMR